MCYIKTNDRLFAGLFSQSSHRRTLSLTSRNYLLLSPIPQHALNIDGNIRPSRTQIHSTVDCFGGCPLHSPNQAWRTYCKMSLVALSSTIIICCTHATCYCIVWNVGLNRFDFGALQESGGTDLWRQMRPSIYLYVVETTGVVPIDHLVGMFVLLEEGPISS